MLHKLVLATRNQGKIIELRRILDSLSVGVIELVGSEEFPELEDVEETGSSFEENALIKARAICTATELPAIADDSGLCVDFLKGAPGIYSARFAGRHGDDRANNEKLLKELIDVPAQARGAHFACVSALVMPDGGEVTRYGQFDGSILFAPIGEQGFGYDPIFKPLGYEISSAQMSPESKDAISHRGKSMRALAPFVIEMLTALG